VTDWNRYPESMDVRNFYGGDLQGVLNKMDYLEHLGVEVIYFNPLFVSPSNHKYDIQDYDNIDPHFGKIVKDEGELLHEGDNDNMHAGRYITRVTNKENLDASNELFAKVVAEAHKRGIRVILDGVFNHTGSNSVYFNAKGFYPGLGAAQSKNSPYASWYHFTRFPDEYDAWWGFKTLPDIEETDPGYMDFIIEGQDSVVRHWLRAGASGWRLDVADELPGVFIEHVRRAMTEEKPDAYLVGEVWEDGSNKIAYSTRRKYLLGAQTHGLMNYPFRDALLGYLLQGNAAIFRDAMESLRENYPPAAFYGAMNFLSTHDTPRLLTVLGYTGPWPQSREERARMLLNASEYHRGMRRLRLAALVMYAFPGCPTVYYGDEAGMQGFEDPFNRATYPWGREDHELIAYFTRLGALRGARESLKSGTLEYLLSDGALLAFRRAVPGECSVAVCNAGDAAVSVGLPWTSDCALDALTGRRFPASGDAVQISLEHCEGMLLIEG
jgi:4-alpha-glucanotransferase